MIRVVGEPISLEEAHLNHLEEAKAQSQEIAALLELTDDVLRNPVVLKALREVLAENKKLLDKIVSTEEAIEHWKKHPEAYAKIKEKMRR